MVEYIAGKASELKDGQMKEVVLGNNYKVLLSKIGGQVYATSHKCTHYGAALSKGALSSEGRIICPWHGACFNAKTGDIEDSPGLDNLQKFKVTIKNDDIYVEGDEAAFKSGRRPPICKEDPSPFNDDVVVIIGGGASGNAATEKLREDGYTGRIIVVSRESYLPIDRTKLSKGFSFGLEKLTLRKKEFYNDLFIIFKLGTSATEVDPKSKIVTLDNGEKLKYNSLIIATGTHPRSIPIPGIDLKNVLYLRTYDDYKDIAKAVTGDEKKNIVIIGSSFIGMEISAIIASKANVSVIGMEKVPFERVLGEKIGAVFQKLHENAGVKFYMRAGVKAIEPSEIDPSIGGAVVLQDGTKIKADAIIVGAGVVPSTDFLKNTAGFTLERDGSLKVTEDFKVEGLEDVYAIGDIARFPYFATNETLRIEHWSFAENTGRAAAEAITTKKILPFKRIPYFWSNQLGKGLRYCGYASSYDDVIVQGSLEEMKFGAFYARGDKIVAVASMAKDPLVSHSSELLRLGIFPTATEVRNGKDPLDVPLTA